MKPRRSESAWRGPVLVANPGADLYGSDRVLLETVSALRSRGHDVVVTLPAVGPLVVEITDRGGVVEVCPTPVIRRSMLNLRGLLHLGGEAVRSIGPSLSLIHNVNPELIYVNTITPPLWLVLAKISRRPSICHVHEGEASTPRALRRAINLPLLLADRLIANSEFSRAVLLDALPRLAKTSDVVHNSVPGPVDVVPPRVNLQGGCRILFVGRLSPRKGPDVAIAALALLRARGVDATLDVVGAVFPGYEWFERDLVDLVGRLALEDVVRFHGFQRDIWPHAAAADVIVVPSTLEESFGNAAVESLLAARPLVVSDIGGLTEAIAGFEAVRIVPPKDPQSISDAIQAIIAGWVQYRGWAISDSVAAAERYSAQEYGRQILMVLNTARIRRRRVRALWPFGQTPGLRREL